MTMVEAANRSSSALRTLIIVENLPVPFDRRVWSEARALRRAGYGVSIICPRMHGETKKYELLEGIHIYRHPLPVEAKGALAYFAEYACALFWQFTYSVRVLRQHGFDVIHGCNPPDLIFLVGGFYKLFFRKKFLFDHHDLNPELFEAKFGRRGFLWRCLMLLERLTFRAADVSIATNESYRRIAVERGGMTACRVFTVRSAPDLDRVRPGLADAAWKKGRAHLVAYIGVIGQQEGLDLLVEAADHIIRRQNRQDVQFVIMGSGPAAREIEAHVERRRLNEYMDLPGRVSDETLFSVLATADVCVNPDRPTIMNDKSTMNKVLEYMAMGKPIVQFSLAEGRASALESSLYARNTDAADFGDKILELIDDPARRNRMGAFGRRRIEEELCWTKEAPKLLAAYAALFQPEVAR
jgi:glycosyltransferase involved in cell wall biosynthesis